MMKMERTDNTIKWDTRKGKAKMEKTAKEMGKNKSDGKLEEMTEK